MDGLTIFHEPGNYRLASDDFLPPHCCWVREAKPRYPCDDGWHVWKDDDKNNLFRRVAEALANGVIEETR